MIFKEFAILHKLPIARKPNKNMKQAPRIYKTEQLVEMMEIICENLPTDVTPNTLETIFIDLVPDFLPHEFLIEKAFKICYYN